jgi:hypothetical protein
MGFFAQAEKIVSKTGHIVKEVAQDINKNTEGWGTKADQWLDKTSDKIETKIKKDKTPNNSASSSPTPTATTVSEPVTPVVIVPEDATPPAPRTLRDDR